MLETRTAQDRKLREEAICPSRQMRRVYDFVARVARTDLDVLISGEQGIGKETMARRIHRLSNRSGKSFIKVDPSQLEASLFAGGLLGLRPFVAWSAWTSRDQATLYFDEITELSESSQAAMLQMILDRDSHRTNDAGFVKPQARILAATCRDLWKEVSSGRFREDLFLRLHAVEIAIPPLRQRPDDLPVLVAAFEDELAREGLRPRSFNLQPPHFRALATCLWPGNLRELRELVRQIALNGSDPSTAIDAHLRKFGRSDDMTEQRELSLSEAARLTSVVVERRLIRKALEETGGDPKSASQRLNISYRALLVKMRNLEIAQ